MEKKKPASSLDSYTRYTAESIGQSCKHMNFDMNTHRVEVRAFSENVLVPLEDILPDEYGDMVVILSSEVTEDWLFEHTVIILKQSNEIEDITLEEPVAYVLKQDAASGDITTVGRRESVTDAVLLDTSDPRNTSAYIPDETKVVRLRLDTDITDGGDIRGVNSKFLNTLDAVVRTMNDSELR